MSRKLRNHSIKKTPMLRQTKKNNSCKNHPSKKFLTAVILNVLEAIVMILMIITKKIE